MIRCGVAKATEPTAKALASMACTATMGQAGLDSDGRRGHITIRQSPSL